MIEEPAQEAVGVAVVGMAGRFPGAGDLATFWRNLREGVESITRLSREELLAAGVDPRELDAPGYVPAGSFLDGPEYIDAGFFGLNAREAELMDPQQRLFLEQAWQALEDAGYDAELYEGAIAVFGGMNLGSYLIHHLLGNRRALRDASPVEVRIRNDKDFLASLVAYKLGCTGPSVSVQTACSTSLVAVSMACQSLLSYQCDMALAGGVSIKCPPRTGYQQQEGVFSPDGRCRAFDAGAQGTVSGDGVGVVVLKRLADALVDGDSIRAVIKGFAINNDGSLKVGYTAPSVEGQAEAIAMAQALAGVDPATVTYVEAHGTGTPMGDPIEVAALTQVFRQTTDRSGFCALGSVKTNIGHLDAAAGAASLIKTVLALQHGVLPPSLGFERPNPAIDFASTPFYVNTRAQPWVTPAGQPRRAGVSAFAVGGVNAHLVVEEAPAPAASGPSRPWQLLLLSARSGPALEAATDRLVAHLRTAAAPGPELCLADVAHTLQVGRRPFEHRRFLVCRDGEDAATALAARDASRILEAVRWSRPRPVAFLFPGLGNHYPGMARELYAGEPTFRAVVDRCCTLLEGELGCDLRQLLFPPPVSGAAPEAGIDLRRMVGRSGESGAGELRRTLLAQPAVFVIEYALARLWIEWGIEPQALVGYSIGEYVAACLAEVLTLEQALRLVALRARWIDELPAGAMLAVSLPEAEVRPALRGGLSLSAVVGPEVCVVAGPLPDVERLQASLEERGVNCRPLETTHAFHSEMMRPLVARFAAAVGEMELQPPVIPYLSNVTGAWITAEQATDPGYWAQHLVAPVRFAACIDELWQEPGRILLEVGPGQALGAWALQHPSSAAAADPLVLSSLPHAYDPQSAQAFMLRALGRLWLAGLEPDWRGFYQHERRRRLPLPTYPFERQRYWIEAAGSTFVAADAAADPGSVSLDKQSDLADWLWRPVWREAPLPIGGEEPGRRFLLFADGAGLAEELARRLSAAGHEVVLARSGAAFVRHPDGTFEFAPGRGEEYELLLGALAEEGRLPREIVHCLSVGDGESLASLETDQASAELGFFSLLRLAQAIGQLGLGEPLRLTVLADGLCDVAGEELLAPGKATLLGPLRVIPQELLNVTCRAFDLVWPPAGARREIAGEQLAAAVRSADESADLVALRGVRRWVQDFAPLRLDAAASEPRLDGTYLITGGLGDIALVVAEQLAKSARVKLALVGRTPVPAREGWHELLAVDPASAADTSVQQRIRRLQELEALGAEVQCYAADVTDRDAMTAVVADVARRCGRITGVIHAAGVYPGGLIQLKSPAAAAQVLAPKVQGTRVLSEVLAADPPDFLLLCSSLTSQLGGFGLVDHAGANAFLDAAAVAAVRHSGIPTLAVGWDTWLEVGQAARGARQLGREPAASEAAAAPAPATAAAAWTAVEHPLLQARAEIDDQIVFRASLTGRSHWVVDEHRLGGQALLPGTAYLEMARAALAAVDGADDPVLLENLLFTQPLTLDDQVPREVQLTLRRDGTGAELPRYDLTVSSRDRAGAPWRDHVRGRVSRAAAETPVAVDIAAIRRRLQPIELNQEPMGEGSAELSLGARWREVGQEMWRQGDEVLCELTLAERFADDLASFPIHPALVDCATGFVRALRDELFLPLSYDRVTLYGPVPRRVYSHLRRAEELGAARDTLVCDLEILDPEGRPRIDVRGYTLRRAVVPSASTREEEGGGDDARTLLLRGYQQGILPAEGAQVFARLLARAAALPAAGVPRLLVSVRHFPAWLQQTRAVSQQRLLEEALKLREHRSRHQRPDLGTPYVEPRTALESALCEVWQELIGLEAVGVHDNFFDAGGDSLLATQLLGQIRSSYRVELPLRDLFAAPTVAELAVKIVQRQATEKTDLGAVDQLLGEIESLSEEELAVLLAAEGAGQEERHG